MIAAVALALCIMGCDSNGEEDADEQTPPAEEQTVQQGEEDEPDELVLKARELAPLADLLEDDPDQLDGWLEEREMTEDELEDLLFEIAGDEEASRAYSEAR